MAASCYLRTSFYRMSTLLVSYSIFYLIQSIQDSSMTTLLPCEASLDLVRFSDFWPCGQWTTCPTCWATAVHISPSNSSVYNSSMIPHVGSFYSCAASPVVQSDFIMTLSGCFSLCCLQRVTHRNWALDPSLDVPQILSCQQTVSLTHITITAGK